MDTPSIPLTLDGAETMGWLDWLKALGFGLAAAVLVFIAVVGFITLLQTSSTLGAVRQGQTTSKATLHQLKEDENTVVSIGGYLEATQRTICVSLHLACPPVPGQRTRG